ncbi:hypothetical protein Scep_026152 [Stephania cephalantha]|uniref:Uncharacterized protein n=1 Tax=Stephania cephalantha TaxID=152367 RepID=A0AAP0EQ68_9MAGN
MEVLGAVGFVGRLRIWGLCVTKRQTERESNSFEAGVDGEQTRAQGWSEAAAASASPYTPTLEIGGHEAVSSWKEKQQATQILGVRACSSLGMMWRLRHLMSPWERGVVAGRNHYILKAS